jgi:hypothetical protein
MNMNNIKYIKYDDTTPGGVGHSMCDYLTVLIISEIYDINIIHKKLKTTLQTRDMQVSNKNNIHFWNDFFKFGCIR